MHSIRMSILAGLLTAGCGDDGGSALADSNSGSGSGTEGPATGADDDGGTRTTTAPDDATGGPPSTSTDGGTDDDSSTGAPPAVPEVHWVGRRDESQPGLVRMGWSGAGFVVRFSGTGASVDLDDRARYFTLLVDGQLQPNLATSPGQQTYVLASGLAAGEHTIELYRRTEGSFGPSVFGAVQIEGELLPPPAVDRRIEFVGDSITAGYGNEGTDPCGFSAETENHYMTWGPIAARTLGAESHMIAWSGKGLVNNYGDDVFEPMPEVYDRTIATEPAPWEVSWQPDVVVVNLGTNDFSTGDDPPEDVFVPAYIGLLEHLRERYPDAYLLIVSPSLFGPEAAMVDGYLQSVADARNAAGDPDVGAANINVDWIGSGCDGHPTVATHEGMAARLVEELEVRVGW